MLEIDIEKVCFIVAKAREFDSQTPIGEDVYEADEPEEHIDNIEDISDSHHHEETDDSTEDEIKAWINAMSHDDQCQIVALAWVGRGDFTAEDWDEALRAATDGHNDRTAEYLLGMPLLPDYLDEGLAAFDLSCG